MLSTERSAIGPAQEGKGQAAKGADRRRNTGHVVQDLTRLLRLIKDKSLDPCIVFSFSRRECEQYAMAAQKLSFNTDEEASAVQEVRAALRLRWGAQRTNQLNGKTRPTTPQLSPAPELLPARRSSRRRCSA